MKYRWLLLPKPNEGSINQLSDKLGFPNSITNLLLQRGINSFEDAKIFFKPSLKYLYDPYLMKDMDKAVNRILKAIENNENILVYGDYDVDGTTSVAMMYLFLKSLYPNVAYYTPDRYSEGYGISYKSIDYAEDNNISLIIALDCGIKENDKVDYALEKNIDFIICDHHRAGADIPNATAILDPIQPECNYPYKYLSGCGVGFKLIQALGIELSIPNEEIYTYLDYVAISIASDIVPITDENRILALHGLELINTKPRPGIAPAINKKSGPVTISSIVFQIAPKINAAGRLKHANYAVELLIAQSKEEADALYINILELNDDRREIDTNITEEALEQLTEACHQDKAATILFDEEWHKGVIGIVASRLIEKCYKPTIIFTRDQETNLLVASARSVKDFDIHNALVYCKEHIDHFGGHMYAAGLSIKEENFEAFKEQFEAFAKENIKENQKIPILDINEEITLTELTPQFFRRINHFEPFGPQNTNPLFLAKNVSAKNIKIIGHTQEHIKLQVYQDNSSILNAIAFKLGAYEKDFSQYAFDMVFSININYWNNNPSYQINIEDINFHKN